MVVNYYHGKGPSYHNQNNHTLNFVMYWLESRNGLKASMTGKAQPVTIPVMVTTNTSQLAATKVLYLARQEWTAVLAMLGPCHHALPRIVAGCTREQVDFA